MSVRRWFNLIQKLGRSSEAKLSTMGIMFKTIKRGSASKASTRYSNYYSLFYIDDDKCERLKTLLFETCQKL